MRLRNKTTGEIITLKDEGELALLKLIEDSLPNGLNVWEEVKEPLIKDEKIRRAVRAWAESWENADRWAYWEEDGEEFHIARGDIEIFFPVSNGVKDGEYTIAELCGEGEQ